VGTLRGGTTFDERFGAEFVPSKSPPQVVNRRAAFRVSSSLRVNVFGRTSDPSAETLDSEWTGALRDLSVGGAKLVLASPPPAERSRIQLRLPLETEREPLLLTGVVLEASPGRNPPPMDAVVRLMFEEVTQREENLLGSYINRMQLDHSRKGVR
jgi:c-di-GMP-binding flagellar brake protein YcgR